MPQNVKDESVQKAWMQVCRWFGTIAECRDKPCKHWDETPEQTFNWRKK